jgi:hypothetical protein
MDISEVKKRLFAAHGESVTIIESTFVGFKKKASFNDSEYGPWDAFVYAVCRGGRHPERFRETRRTTPEEANRRLLEKHGSIITIDPTTWKNGSQCCTFIDVEFGKFDAQLCNVLSGIGHPERVKKQRGDSQRMTEDEIRCILKQQHNNIVELVGPYLGACVPCIFRDVEFGEFTALPLNVLRGTGHIKRAVKRRQQTSIERFGTTHHMQNTEVFLKNMRKQRHHYKEVHWKSQQILDCTGTWEVATVRWLNERKIDFIWQPRAFKMPNGKTYRPDAFIIDMNLWIDVKGYFPETSRFKCDWFKTIMPNFEVWQNDKLHELGILPFKF